MLRLIIVIAALYFLSLQAYAILLGGLYNIIRTAKPHDVLERAVLIIGYILAGTHSIFHLVRGLAFRVGSLYIWPPSWLLKG